MLAAFDAVFNCRHRIVISANACTDSSVQAATATEIVAPNSDHLPEFFLSDSSIYEKHFGGTEFQNRFKKRRKHLLNLGSLEKDCLRTKHFRLALFRVQRES